MASPESVIQQLAFEIDGSAQKRASGQKKELREIEQRKQELLAAMDQADSTRGRLKSFKPLIGQDYQCPRYWVATDRHRVLQTRTGDRHGDRFECPVCFLEIRVPFDD